MASKRKRLEGFTQASLKTSNKKVEEVWKTQQEERSVVLQELLDQNICMLYSLQGILHLLTMELCVTYGSLPFPMSPTCTPHSPSLPFSLHSPHTQAATWCRVQEAGARGTLTVGDGRGEEQRAGGKVAQDVERTAEALPTAAHCAVPETKDHQTTP